MRVVFDSGPFAPLRQNMTPFTKPEEYSEGIAAKRLQIYHRLSRRKNFKNRATFGNVTGKSVIPMTLNHLQGHSRTASFFHM